MNCSLGTRELLHFSSRDFASCMQKQSPHAWGRFLERSTELLTFNVIGTFGRFETPLQEVI